MDAQRFDALTRALSLPGSRRRGLLGALLALLALLTWRDPEEATARKRRKNRRRRHKHGQGRPKNRRKKRKNRKKCQRKPRKKICANRCGIIKNRKTCKKKINCGPCACDPPCTVLGEECVDGVCVQTCPDLPPNADLQAAINATPAGGTLTLCPGAWHLTATVSISKKLTLRGAGAVLTVLDGPGTELVLRIEENAEVTLQDLTVTGGDGGIDNLGTLTLHEATVSGNEGATSGGGIYNNGGTLTLQAGSRVSGNRARFGGGLYNDGGTIDLLNESVVGSDSPVDGNTATSLGGGIYNNSGTLTLQNGSRVVGNTATNDGGAIYNANGVVTVQPGAFVCNNEPDDSQCAPPGIANCPNSPGGTCSA